MSYNRRYQDILRQVRQQYPNVNPLTHRSIASLTYFEEKGVNSVTDRRHQYDAETNLREAADISQEDKQAVNRFNERRERQQRRSEPAPDTSPADLINREE